MDERLRQEYLQRMGIQSYFSRGQLPGAALSVERIWDVDTPSSTEAVAGTEIPSMPKAPDPARQQTQVITPAEAPSEQTADNPEISEEVRFQLAFIRVSDAVLALVLLPYVQDTGTLNNVQKRLFTSLCRALKLPVSSLDFSIKAFRWPFSEATFLDKSEGAARAALNTYLSQLQEDGSFTHLLLLGGNIEYLLSEFREQLEGELLVCRSLDEMLKMPTLKRETWKLLSMLAR